MFLYALVFIFIAISPAVSSVVRNLASTSTCRANEFTCLDGTCIRAGAVCDTNRDCPDGSDEASCYSSTNSNLTEATVSHQRYKRQSPCGSYQWPCTDGTCIAFDGKCDGMVDCPDGSDETHALCRNIKCQNNWFKCTYGACVDGTAPCNNIIECADQSDELLPRCRNDDRLSNGKFRCLDGKLIPASDLCDGTKNCPDGSDETVRACAGQICPTHLFQCAYGACVDQGADCNEIIECADGSDEAPELCNIRLRNNIITTSTGSKKCVLPPYPEHGTYVEVYRPYATPGQNLETARLNVTCEHGYGLVNDTLPYCLYGEWHIPIQKCVPFCRLDRDVSVYYYCQVPGTNGYRICKQFEPSGTLVNPVCNAPNYGSRDVLLSMTCQSDGTWNRIVKCTPECGRVTPKADGLVFNGTEAVRGELPWHVAIYRKKKGPYFEQICGGSLVSNRIVISAGHCFRIRGINEKPRASKYAVATAKLFREWDHTDDTDAQKSELKSIELSDYYQGVRTNFQHDIAVLILKTPFVYYNYVRPVCLDFERDFNARQLQKGKFGKVAGWGLTDANGLPSPVLQVVELPIVPIDECIRITPETFTESITGDKICAGYNDGMAAVCKGDSGGGLSFPEPDRGTMRYYLRGVVSTAPPKVNNSCNTGSVTTFTEIYQHRDFISHLLSYYS